MLDEELRTLLTRAQAGDQDAKELILESNLNLVRSILHRFTNRGFEWDDLFQLGCIGLMKAIERFDTKYDVKFSTYAVPMIIGEIRRFMRDDSPVKVSRPLKELAFKVHKTQERLQGILGREPTINEVAADMETTPQEIVNALDAIQPPASLYDQTYNDDGDVMQRFDQITSSESPDNELINNLALQEVISRLPLREQKIIELRFFQDRTQAEIAAIIGISQVQVSRIEKHALKLIRTLLQTS